ncbi:MAG: ERF family protein [Candidatus Amulumruptor caecigallinarius]|nr:ERF family protein [Candidatus Amulumruptor caecigallinarius]MCM1397426.1 ERF family protein [Candidatus Amulumruptor caecigallinarius]MCM1454367.1 ERF family protein [bacterium]
MEDTQSNFMSEAIDQITVALSAFQGEVEQPQLNKENPYFKSRYVDLSGVLKAAQPILAKNGLCVAQIISGGDLITLLSHKSGQWLKSICPIGNYKNQQERGSAITYTKRYAICAILGIAADTDDDGNSASDADKKRGGIGNAASHAAPATFTGAQLQQAISEVNAVNDMTEFEAVWGKWAKAAPAICNYGTEFYKAAGAKAQQLRSGK